MDTTGSFTAGNSLADWAIVLALLLYLKIVNFLGKPEITGRIAGKKAQNITSAAGDLRTVKSDAINKLRKLAELIAKNPQAVINNPILNLMYIDVYMRLPMTNLRVIPVIWLKELTPLSWTNSPTTL